MKRSSYKRLLAAAAVVFFLMAALSAYEIYKILREYRQGDQDLEKMYAVMDSIAQNQTEASSAPGMVQDPEAEEKKRKEAARLAQYAELKKVNEDVAGWIKIDGTVIDYPVMHTPENPDFYLKKGFDKKYSAYGMIYMEEACGPKTESRNYILYGHHMKNGSMFAALEKYASKEFWEAHPTLLFDTLEETGEYQIAAAFKMPASEITDTFMRYLMAQTEEDYEKLIEYAGEKGFYDTGIIPQWPEQLVSLVTCEYSYRDGRFIVLARKTGE